MTGAMSNLGFISPGGGELLVIVLVLIMLFGAKDAPRILRKMQDFFDELRRTANSFRHDMLYSDLYAETPSDPGSVSVYEAAEYEVDEDELMLLEEGGSASGAAVLEPKSGDPGNESQDSSPVESEIEPERPDA